MPGLPTVQLCGQLMSLEKKKTAGWPQTDYKDLNEFYWAFQKSVQSKSFTGAWAQNYPLIFSTKSWFALPRLVSSLAKAGCLNLPKVMHRGWTMSDFSLSFYSQLPSFLRSSLIHLTKSCLAHIHNEGFKATYAADYLFTKSTIATYRLTDSWLDPFHIPTFGAEVNKEVCQQERRKGNWCVRGRKRVTVGA